MTTKFEETCAVIRFEFPKFRVKKYADSLLFAVIWSLGWRMGATTIWNTVYMHPEYVGTDRGAEMLKHELVHLRDQHRWPVLFFLSYLLLLPVGPSFKAFWEWRAYRETMRLVWVSYRGCEPALREQVMNGWVEYIASRFWSPKYLWMWPFKEMVRKWCYEEYFKLRIGARG